MVMCMVMCMESELCLGGCNAIATEDGGYCLSCMQKLWSAQAVPSLYGMLECKLCCEILLLNMADILYEEGWEMSSVDRVPCFNYLVSVNRLMCM